MFCWTELTNKFTLPFVTKILFYIVLLQVTSPYGNALHHNENVTGGQFAFTTTEAGNYLACFWVDGHHGRQVGASVNIDWRMGIAAKDWDSVAKKEKIEAST